MWIFLSNSMLSIVQKPGDSATLTVRARIKGDIERVFPNASVSEGTGTDYRFRARVPREEVALRMADAVRDVNYSNFKSSVKDRSRHDALMAVWDAMYRYQERQSVESKPIASSKRVVGISTKEQILKSYGLNYGISSGHRILGACNGYYREFGSWPTKLLVDPDMAHGLIEQTFTDKGWSMLASKMTVTTDVEGTVIVEGPDGRHEYSGDQYIRDGRPQADEWIWGISFSE